MDSCKISRKNLLYDLTDKIKNSLEVFFMFKLHKFLQELKPGQ